ncbi:MAG: type II toxin-antitoxin system HipA family toxin [Denitrovibrio sp.]|nr:MAG: type II toxin-antitoxin system HipA family toxin [Denitrovibrio sp.]
MESLNVFLETDNSYSRVGLLSREGTSYYFEYDTEFLSSKVNSISIKLPKNNTFFEGLPVQVFFENLLPEAEQRKIVASSIGISEGNFFGLLSRFGEECAGALVITQREHFAKSDQGYAYLSESEFTDIIKKIETCTPATKHKGYRLSLAGAQAKFSVKIKGNEVSLPLNDSPSTHLIKPFSRRFEALPVNEYFCTYLAKKAGLNTCNSELFKYGTETVLSIERYDRIISENSIARMHQEDFCQALGFPYSMKYEEEGGPSFKQCLDLIIKISAQPALDKQQLIKWVIFNFLIGNADAHAKNISLLYRGHYNEKVTLAPFYDLVSTNIYEGLTKRFAMSIGEADYIDEMDETSWEFFAKECGIKTKTLYKYYSEINTAIKTAFKDISGAPYNEIKAVFKERSRMLRKWLKEI